MQAGLSEGPPCRSAAGATGIGRSALVEILRGIGLLVMGLVVLVGFSGLAVLLHRVVRGSGAPTDARGVVEHSNLLASLDQFAKEPPDADALLIPRSRIQVHDTSERLYVFLPSRAEGWRRAIRCCGPLLFINGLALFWGLIALPFVVRVLSPQGEAIQALGGSLFALIGLALLGRFLLSQGRCLLQHLCPTWLVVGDNRLIVVIICGGLRLDETFPYARLAEISRHRCGLRLSGRRLTRSLCAASDEEAGFLLDLIRDRVIPRRLGPWHPDSRR